MTDFSDCSDIEDILRTIAEEYFGENGACDLIRDEFNKSEEFVAGQRRGHEDAYQILMGEADAVRDDTL